LSRTSATKPENHTGAATPQQRPPKEKHHARTSHHRRRPTRRNQPPSALKELKAWFNESGKIVHAEAYDPAGLVAILEVRAVSDKEILVLECSRDQIQAALEWQSATDEVVEFENLLLHLVRKQNPTGESK